MKYKTGRKAMSWLLSLALVLGIVFGLTQTALAAPSGTELTAGGGTLSEGSYYLGSDITLTNNIIVNSGSVTIDLNGHGL